MSLQELPLEGVRVIEFTHAVMGPVAGLVLADLGADVIRIEPAPLGDHTRHLKGFGTGYYTFYNRNKKSGVIDLKDKRGYEIAIKILETADVMIENYGPGTIDRLGLGYDRVKQINERLIYCQLKGFMPGPYENRIALDEVVQMMSGLAYMTGPTGTPLRAGASVIDIMGGTYGALGILVALRERDRTGTGSLVRNGLFETAAFIMGQHMAYAAISNLPIPPMPDRISAWAIYRLFETGDGRQVFIGVTSDKQWKQFCQHFERPDLYDDPALTTNNDRILQRDRLIPELEAIFKRMPLDEIIRRSERAGIAFSPIAQPGDLLDDPQLNDGNSLLEVTLPDGAKTKLPRLPLDIQDTRFDLISDAPNLGEHTASLLNELGYTSDSIRDMHEAGIVVAAEHLTQQKDFTDG